MMVAPDLAEEAQVEAPRPSKKSRRSKRRPDAIEGVEMAMLGVLSHETSVLSAFVAEDDPAYAGLIGLRGEGGGGFGEGVAVGIGEVHGVVGGVVDVIEGGVEGGVPGGVVGVEGGVVGGVEGGVVNGVVGGVMLEGSMPEAPGPAGHVPPNMAPGKF
ncbi:hypothetical protein [Nannocystis pusilla]|uniref:hypothetical protein n=1 Tax=Nannocystis pusilla TaxID=889268 RepID=UPI003B770CB4